MRVWQKLIDRYLCVCLCVCVLCDLERDTFEKESLFTRRSLRNVFHHS